MPAPHLAMRDIGNIIRDLEMLLRVCARVATNIAYERVYMNNANVLPGR
jgi:hypothetical protein